MKSFTLKSIPNELTWKNTPVSFESKTGDGLDITAGPVSDWFHNPGGTSINNNAPVALFTPSAENFLLSAKVTVEFNYTYDAGVLFLYVKDDIWAKLCFEYSPQKEAMVVSVVTRGKSDDCNSAVIGSHTVYLRVFRQGNAVAYHYSTDGHTWHFVRYFNVGDLGKMQIGFAEQSPTGKGCTVHFSEIDFHYGKISDLRSGE